MVLADLQIQTERIRLLASSLGLGMAAGALVDLAHRVRLVRPVRDLMLERSAEVEEARVRPDLLVVLLVDVAQAVVAAAAE